MGTLLTTNAGLGITEDVSQGNFSWLIVVLNARLDEVSSDCDGILGGAALAGQWQHLMKAAAKRHD